MTLHPLLACNIACWTRLVLVGLPLWRDLLSTYDGLKGEGGGGWGIIDGLLALPIGLTGTA